MDPQQLFSVAGKVALITGSARGIGKTLAEGLVAAGAKVWLADILEADGQQTADALNMPFVPTDLSESDDIKALVERISAEEDRLDILINNAALDRIVSLDTVEMADLDIVMRVNLYAPVELTKRLLPLLRAAQGASIINITSVHQETPHPQNFPYNLSKSALAMFTKSMAQELGPQGIRINNIAPGAVETDINRDILAEMGLDNFNQWIPLGRVAQTSEIVGPALFLASAASSYVNGATLVADGGYLHNLVRYRLDV